MNRPNCSGRLIAFLLMLVASAVAAAVLPTPVATRATPTGTTTEEALPTKPKAAQAPTTAEAGAGHSAAKDFRTMPYLESGRDLVLVACAVATVALLGAIVSHLRRVGARLDALQQRLTGLAERPQLDPTDVAGTLRDLLLAVKRMPKELTKEVGSARPEVTPLAVAASPVLPRAMPAWDADHFATGQGRWDLCHRFAEIWVDYAGSLESREDELKKYLSSDAAMRGCVTPAFSEFKDGDGQQYLAALGGGEVGLLLPLGIDRPVGNRFFRSAPDAAGRNLAELRRPCLVRRINDGWEVCENGKGEWA